MLAAILQAVLTIYTSVSGIFKKREEIRQEEKKVAQSESNIKTAEVIRAAEQKDRAEELIKNIKDAESPEQREKWLNELRKRISS